MKPFWSTLLVLTVCLSVAHGQPSQSGFAHSDGVNIYYEVYGFGSPVLIINGGPGFSSEGFTGLAEKLAEKYQVILYDQRGTGRSVMDAVNASNMTMDLMVKDMEALRSHLGLSEWTLLGHSFGLYINHCYTTRFIHRR